MTEENRRPDQPLSSSLESDVVLKEYYWKQFDSAKLMAVELALKPEWVRKELELHHRQVEMHLTQVGSLLTKAEPQRPVIEQEVRPRTLRILSQILEPFNQRTKKNLSTIEIKQPPSPFWVYVFIPAKSAKSINDMLDDLYADVWIPKFGVKAKVIYRIQIAWSIADYWWDQAKGIVMAIVKRSISS